MALENRTGPGTGEIVSKTPDAPPNYRRLWVALAIVIIGLPCLSTE